MRTASLLFCAFLACALVLGATPESQSFSIMTQNMDAGTDLGFALFGLQKGNLGFYVDLTLEEVAASSIPSRAANLAAEIAAKKPSLVALQEVTLWRTGPAPETATVVAFDQLELLTAALKGLGAHYEVVAVNTLTDIALPGTTQAVRFTDRDVLLARTDLPAAEFKVLEAQANLYKAAVSFGPDITVLRGFIAAKVKVGRKVVRVADTHLENQYPGVEEATVIQALQAGELIRYMRTGPEPVVLAGDFNADAILGVQGSGPDNTGTVKLVEEAGYRDSWVKANPSEPGATWPLFLEDQPGTYFAPATPFERIDLIFFNKELHVTSSIKLATATASDHAGVITEFELPQ